MIDSGNLLPSGMAVAEDFCLRNGLKFIPTKHLPIGTACTEGTGLWKIGCMDIDVSLNNQIKILHKGAWVVRNLTCQANIGSAFLKKHQINLLFDDGTPQLQCKQGTIPMICALNTEDTLAGMVEKKTQIFKLVESTTCKPDSMKRVNIALPGSTEEMSIVIEEQPLEDGVGILPGCYRVNQGIANVWLMNTSENPVLLPEKWNIEAKVSEDGSWEVHRMETDDAHDNDDFKTLLKKLKIDDNEVLKQNPTIKKQLVQLLYRYKEVFATEDQKVGHTELTECELVLKQAVEPIRQKLRPMNPSLEASLKKQLDEWLNDGVIQPSKSPWSSPLVPVKKKTGEIRWTVDFRKLNAQLKQDSFPLPRIAQLLEKAGGKRIYSILDASQAYLTIPMAAKSREMTAFSTPWGLFEFIMMPFGLSTAPSVYSRFIAAVLNPLGDRGLAVYLDDILLHHMKLSDHLKKMEEVLEKHKESGIRLKPSKCELFQTEIQYLGHKLSKDGIGMVNEYVERILTWPAPSTIKELNTFLGFLSYYREFITDFSKLVAPMTSQKKAKKLEWTAQCQDNFMVLKEKFKEAPIRSTPRFDLETPFILTIDYSGVALSAILSQFQGGRERLIAAGGRKTTKGEQGYCSWKGEMAALIYGVRKYHHILSYRKFILVTDASVLKNLGTLKANKGIVSRWLDELAGVEYTVQHRPGKQNKNADALSRSHHLPEPSQEEENEDQYRIIEVRELILTRELIREHQAKDETLKKVRLWISAGEPPSKEQMKGEPLDVHMYKRWMPLINISEDGVLELRRESQSPEGGRAQILVPDALRDQVFKYCHQHSTAGHFGQEATWLKAVRDFYYVGMRADLNNRIKLCTTCWNKDTKAKLKAGKHVPRRTGYPLELVAIDLVGPLPVDSTGWKYILTAEDVFTKFSQCYPLKSKKTEEVAAVFNERFVANYGCPQAIISDNGKEFSSEVFEQLMKELRIEKKNTPPYNPHSNNVERLHRTINAYMRMTMDREETDWYNHLPALTLAYNTKVNAATGLTPYFSFFGREARLPADLMVRLPRQESLDLHQMVKDTLLRYRRIYDYIRQHGEAVIRRNSAQYSGKDSVWTAGTLVYYLCPRRVPGKPAKITNVWLGPYRIVKRIGEVLLRITPAMQEGKEMTVHISRVRAYISDGRITSNIPRNLEVVEDDPEAEEISTPRAATQPELAVPVQIPLVEPSLMEDKGPARDPVEERITKPNQRTIPQDEVLHSPAAHEEDEEMPAADQGVPMEVVQGAVQQENQPSSGQRKNIRKREKTLSPQVGWREKSARLLSESSSEEGSDEEMLQMQMQCLDVKVQPGSTIPVRASRQAAGYDVRATVSCKLKPKQVTPVDINLKLQIPQGYYGQLMSRSGLATQGIFTVGGVLDADYRGPIKVLLHNSTEKVFRIEQNQRISQLLFLRSYEAHLQEAELQSTARNHGGFGSTGNH